MIKLGETAGVLSGFSLRLIPTITAETFPLSKLSPERCNLKTATAAAPAPTAAGNNSTAAVVGKKRKRPEQDAHAASAKKVAVDDTGTGGEANKAPTPLYNESIIADMMTEQHQQVQQAVLEAVPKLNQAMVLLKVCCLSYLTDFSFHTPCYRLCLLLPSDKTDHACCS